MPLVEDTLPWPEAWRSSQQAAPSPTADQMIAEPLPAYTPPAPAPSIEPPAATVPLSPPPTPTLSIEPPAATVPLSPPPTPALPIEPPAATAAEPNPSQHVPKPKKKRLLPPTEAPKPARTSRIPHEIKKVTAEQPLHTSCRKITTTVILVLISVAAIGGTITGILGTVGAHAPGAPQFMVAITEGLGTYLCFLYTHWFRACLVSHF